MLLLGVCFEAEKGTAKKKKIQVKAQDNYHLWRNKTGSPQKIALLFFYS